MAKVFKFSGYYVDPNDDYTDDWLEHDLDTKVGMVGGHIKIESVDIGEWTDDNPLNYYDCDISEYEKYFK